MLQDAILRCWVAALRPLMLIVTRTTGWAARFNWASCEAVIRLRTSQILTLLICDAGGECGREGRCLQG